MSEATLRSESTLPAEILETLQTEADRAGGAFTAPERDGRGVGRTMFDLPSSEDQSVVVLLPQERLQELPSQALVRIHSERDRRTYLGMVTAGPFSEPDGLRGDAPLVVATGLQGTLFIPRYHGRVHVTILGEEVGPGTLIPPRFRPLPNSWAEPLDREETIKILEAGGDIRLGLAVGHEDVTVGVPSGKKAVLPRHTAFLGTTGSGKSTSVANFISQAQQADLAVVLLDVEGEYTHLHEPATNTGMLQVLRERGIMAAGVPNTRLYHLVRRETANPGHPHVRPFCLRFSDLSPYAIGAILDLSEAQQDRLARAYDVARQLLRELEIFPRKGADGRPLAEDEKAVLDWDEFDTGYPEMELLLLLDVVQGFLHAAEKGEGDPNYYHPRIKGRADALKKRIPPAKSDSVQSWRVLRSRLWRLHHLRVFDQRDVPPLDAAALIAPGRVSIVDLSDSDSPQLNNLAIASLLRNIQRAQEAAYDAATRGGRDPVKTLVIIEEAHEFLSSERVEKMPVLFEQVERIAKRGRKRWLGLCFVTQLPQHLPPALLGLVNNFVLHKISDTNVISRLQRTIPGIDESLWKRLPGLAPGQAIVSLASMTRPLLVSMDPAPCALRMVD
jgi:DNA helicase HerA-like ATPase